MVAHHAVGELPQLRAACPSSGLDLIEAIIDLARVLGIDHVATMSQEFLRNGWKPAEIGGFMLQRFAT
jgi:hypothetical protein